MYHMRLLLPLMQRPVLSRSVPTLRSLKTKSTRRDRQSASDAMGMEIKQHLKLSQQLVMTPQLQQAIKLLQLSRIELADVVREELLENPVLEDTVEVAAEQQKPDANEAPVATAAHEAEAERIGETETPVVAVPDDKLDTTAEVKADNRSGEAVADFDWDTYLETQSNAPPMPTYRPNSEDLPSLEATLTRGTSLFDHLEWQLKLSRDFAPAQVGLALLILGNLTPDGSNRRRVRGS